MYMVILNSHPPHRGRRTARHAQRWCRRFDELPNATRWMQSFQVEGWSSECWEIPPDLNERGSMSHLRARHIGGRGNEGLQVYDVVRDMDMPGHYEWVSA